MDSSNSLFKIKWLTNQEDRKECFEIRKQVFQDEQKFTKETEVDEYDSNDNFQTLNLLLLSEEKPIGTVRLYKKNGEKWFLSRFCLLKECRGKKIGNFMMDEFLKKCIELKIDELFLTSQFSAKDFYLKNGFDPIGETFDIEEVPHIIMHKRINL